MIAFLSLVLAAGLQIEGLSRTRKERLQSDEWPPVTAKVIGCYFDRYHSINSHQAVIYKVYCKFSYSINGAEYESRTETVGERHSFSNPAQLPADALQMDAWARRHKKGSVQVVHYDPANPTKISLAGADDDIRTNTAAIALTSARQATFVAIGLLLLALLTRRLSRASG